jgi:lipopolysaccharide exporter
MNEPLAGRVGSAITWKTLQLGADQGLAIVRFLVLARLLAPEDFGLVAIATVAVDLLLALTNVGLQPALIQLPRPEGRHYDAAWTVGSLRGLAISAALFLGAGLIASLYGEPRATSLLQLIALRPLLSGLASPRMADLERAFNFRALALLITAATIVHTVLAIALAPTLGVSAIVVGMLAGTALFTLLSYVAAPYRPRFRLDRRATEPILRFGRWVLATSIVGIVGEAALRAVISRQFGAAELGVYYLAARLAALPSGVVTEIVGSIAFPLHARLRPSPEKGAVAFGATLLSFMALLLPVYLALVALAPALTRDVLGARWEGTAPLIAVLAGAAVLRLVTDAVGPLLRGRGRPELVTVLHVVRTVILLILAWPLAAAFGVVGAAAAILAAEVPVQVLAARYARRTVPRPFAGIGRAVMAAALAGGLGALAGIAVDQLVGPPVGVVPAAIAAAAVSGGTLWLLDRVLDLRLAEQLVRVFPALGRLIGRGDGGVSEPPGP